ncbi:MAG: DUF4149 domain-containing protein [Pseudomonadota bacterium]
MADILALYALTLAFGGMVFFSGVFSPLVFVKLPAETAGPFIRQVFPWYFAAVAATLGAAGLGLLLAGEVMWGGLLVAMALAGVVNREVLMPRINQLRDRQLKGDAAAGQAFDRLHKASVAINLVQMIVAGAALTAFL